MIAYIALALSVLALAALYYGYRKAQELKASFEQRADAARTEIALMVTDIEKRFRAEATLKEAALTSKFESMTKAYADIFNEVQKQIETAQADALVAKEQLSIIGALVSRIAAVVHITP